MQILNVLGHSSIHDICLENNLFAFSIKNKLFLKNILKNKNQEFIEHKNDIKNINFLSYFSKLDQNEIMSTDGLKVAIQMVNQNIDYKQISISSLENEKIKSIYCQNYLIMVLYNNFGYRLLVLSLKNNSIKIALNGSQERQKQFLKIINVSYDQFLICEQEALTIWIASSNELSLKNKISFQVPILDITYNSQQKLIFIYNQKSDILVLNLQGQSVMKIPAIEQIFKSICYLDSKIYLANDQLFELDLFKQKLTLIQNYNSNSLINLNQQCDSLIITHEDQSITINPLKNPIKEIKNFGSFILDIQIQGPNDIYILTKEGLYKQETPHGELKIVQLQKNSCSFCFNKLEWILVSSEGQLSTQHYSILLQKSIQKIQSYLNKLYVQSENTLFIFENKKMKLFKENVISFKMHKQFLMIQTGQYLEIYIEQNLVQKTPMEHALWNMHNNEEIIILAGEKGVFLQSLFRNKQLQIYDKHVTVAAMDPSGLYIGLADLNGIKILEIGTKSIILNYDIQGVTAFFIGHDFIVLVINSSSVMYLEIPKDIQVFLQYQSTQFQAMKMQVEHPEFWNDIFIDLNNNHANIDQQIKPSYNLQIETIKPNYLRLPDFEQQFSRIERIPIQSYTQNSYVSVKNNLEYQKQIAQNINQMIQPLNNKLDFQNSRSQKIQTNKNNIQDIKSAQNMHELTKNPEIQDYKLHQSLRSSSLHHQNKFKKQQINFQDFQQSPNFIHIHDQYQHYKQQTAPQQQTDQKIYKTEAIQNQNFLTDRPKTHKTNLKTIPLSFRTVL